MKLKLEYIFYLFIFLLPWQTRYIFFDTSIEYARMSIYSFDILLFILLISQIVKQRINIRNKKIYLIPLILVAYCFLSIIWSNNQSIALYWSIRILLGFSLFYLIQNINFSRIRLAITVAIAGATQGLLAIWQFLNQSVWESKWLGMAGQKAEDLGVSVVQFGLERWLRAYGSLSHPNILGGFLVLSFIAVIYLATKIKDKYHKLFIIFSSGFITLGIFFSYSRSAWITFLISFILGFIHIRKVGDDYVKKFAKWIWIYLFLLILVFTIATLSIVKTRLNIGPPQRLEVQSNSMRIRSIQESLKIYQDHWLLGTGIGSYTYELKQKYPDLPDWMVEPPHNTYILIFTELGIAFVLFLIFIYDYLIKKIIKNRSYLYSCSLLIVSCLLIFDHYFWTLPAGMYILWLITSLAIKNNK